MATGLNASAADASFRGTDAPMRVSEHHPHALSRVASLPADPVNGGEKLQALIARARQGSPTAIGRLVENARAFLLLTAARHLPQRLVQKVGASDVVQETAIEVQRGFAGFKGTTEAELFGWMRRILLNNVADAIRHYEGTSKRDVARERSLDRHEAEAGAEELPSKKRPPDESVIGHEDAALVATTLEALDPHYREVLHLRYWEQCSFIEIGIRMNRSPEAARKLWYRAVKQFNDALPSR
jgi:RNA polymerase sigma-70 factor (ECF subfamily)